MLVVISNMLKRYSFQIPVLYLQQLYSCYYLERLLIIGLILSCRCYCFIIGPTDSIDYYYYSSICLSSSFDSNLSYSITHCQGELEVFQFDLFVVDRRSICDLFPVILLLFGDVKGSIFQFQILCLE